MPTRASFLSFLEGRGQTFVLGVAIVLILLLGALDFFTGFEVSFAVFYVVPVALAAWFASRRASILVSIASAVTWQRTNALAGGPLRASAVTSSPSCSRRPEWSRPVQLWTSCATSSWTKCA